MRNEGTVAHGVEAKAGWAHVVRGDKRLDLFEQRSVCGDRYHGAAYYDKFPTVQALMLEIYQMATACVPCDIFPMAIKPDKKADAERRARAIYERLMQVRPAELSNNQWTTKAGVSTSFFTNLQGNNKPASEPSIGNLRAVVNAAGLTLSEFFLDEARGRVVRRPTRRELEQALASIWEGLPANPDMQPAYVAQNLLPALGLPERPDSSEDGSTSSDSGDPAGGAPARPATSEA